MLLAALSGALTQLLTALSRQPAPHLIIALVDDLGYSQVGFHNNEQKTPEIDRLATEEGVIFADVSVAVSLRHRRMGRIQRVDFGRQPSGRRSWGTRTLDSNQTPAALPRAACFTFHLTLVKKLTSRSRSRRSYKK